MCIDLNFPLQFHFSRAEDKKHFHLFVQYFYFHNRSCILLCNFFWKSQPFQFFFSMFVHKGFGALRLVHPADSPEPFFCLNFRRLLKIFSNLRKFKMKKSIEESTGATSRNAPKPLCF